MSNLIEKHLLPLVQRSQIVAPFLPLGIAKYQLAQYFQGKVGAGKTKFIEEYQFLLRDVLLSQLVRYTIIGYLLGKGIL
jgi:hypothetical protein